MILLIVFCLIGTGVFMIGKQITLYADPFFLTGVRIIAGGLYFLAYQFFSNRQNFIIRRSWLPLLIGYSICVFILDSFRLVGLKYIPSPHAALIATTAPFIAAILSWIAFKEKINLRKACALILGFVGVMPLLIPRVSFSDTQFTYPFFAYGMVFLSTAAFVVGGIFAKTLLKRGMPFFMLVGTAMTGGGLLGFGTLLLYEPWYPVPISDFSKVIAPMVYLIITHSLIAYPLYNYLISIYPITFVSFTQLILPFLTALLGVIISGEKIGFEFLTSSIILTISLTLFYSEELREGLIKKRS